MIATSIPYKRTRLLVLAFVVLALGQLACKKEKTDIPAEPEKKITGLWHIVKLTRNNIDLSAYMDLSEFAINFKEDGTYTIVNKLPFIVNKDGNWALDDVLHPFAIAFTPAGGTAINSNFNYPVVKGKRQMILVFSPGCNKNSYEYTLQQ